MHTQLRVVVSTVTCVASSCLAQSFAFLTPPSGYDIVRPEGLSFDGRTVAGMVFQGSQTRGFIGSPAGAVVLDSPNDPPLSILDAVSSDGNFTAGQSSIDGAFRRSPSGTLQAIPLVPGFVANRAFDLSANGSRVVGFSGRGRAASEENEAFLWDESSGLTRLGYIEPNGVMSRALAISADGNTVVGFSISGSLGARQDGFVWTAATGMTRLYQQDGTPSFEVVDVSADGRYMIGDGHRWDNGVPMFLGVLPGYTIGFLNEISEDGRVAVGNYSSRGPGLPNRAYVWSDISGIAFLDDYLNSHGAIVPAGLRLDTVYAVSGDGLTFAGISVDSTGNRQGFIATVPAPGALVPFGFAAAAGGGRRRRISGHLS